MVYLVIYLTLRWDDMSFPDLSIKIVVQYSVLPSFSMIPIDSRIRFVTAILHRRSNSGDGMATAELKYLANHLRPVMPSEQERDTCIQLPLKQTHLVVPELRW